MDLMNTDYNSLTPEQKKEFVKQVIAQKRQQFRPKTSDLSPELQKQFANLACALSPENLHEDGEISQAQAQRKYNGLMKQWRELEKQAGRKVSESEAYKY